jgi:putative nucleotidyltransferase with HDIG domain
VRSYALALAARLGVTDARELKALEVAALLHDTGKIAVPDRILNKPGTLTAREFDTMKRHAAVGADILATVDFPYPVVPIVRHHHENWDGSGYPAGLRGTEIPLGARILSVIDCYDALISDRPYRTAMRPQEALDVIRARRGSMYDPDIVDAFERIASSLPAVAQTDAPQIAMARVPPPASSAPVRVPRETTGRRLAPAFDDGLRVTWSRLTAFAAVPHRRKRAAPALTRLGD